MGGRQPLLTYRVLAALCQRGGAELRRVSGSHHSWYFREKMFTIPAHGPGTEIDRVFVRKLRLAWRLMPDDGVSDADFLAGKWEASPLGADGIVGPEDGGSE